MTRVASADLTRQANPDQQDYALAAVLLGIASTLASEDAELLRLRIEATARSGQPGELAPLYERLVRLDPSDEVAWLRLIAERIGKLQTVERVCVCMNRWSAVTAIRWRGGSQPVG